MYPLLLAYFESSLFTVNPEDYEGKRNMSELLIPLNYHMIPNNYAIKPIE